MEQEKGDMCKRYQQVYTNEYINQVIVCILKADYCAIQEITGCFYFYSEFILAELQETCQSPNLRPVTLEECRASAEFLQIQYPAIKGITLPVKEETPGFTTHPKGCYVGIAPSITSQGLYFNHNDAGNPHGSSRSVCKIS